MLHDFTTISSKVLYIFGLCISSEGAFILFFSFSFKGTVYFGRRVWPIYIFLVM